MTFIRDIEDDYSDLIERESMRDIKQRKNNKAEEDLSHWRHSLRFVFFIFLFRILSLNFFIMNMCYLLWVDFEIFIMNKPL